MFVTTHCQILTPNYASTVDTAKALVKAVGGKFRKVKRGSIPSASPDLDYPLLYRYDESGLHVWGYGGDDAKAHMAMARALADIWHVLAAEPDEE